MVKAPGADGSNRNRTCHAVQSIKVSIQLRFYARYTRRLRAVHFLLCSLPRFLFVFIYRDFLGARTSIESIRKRTTHQHILYEMQNIKCKICKRISK